MRSTGVLWDAKRRRHEYDLAGWADWRIFQGWSTRGQVMGVHARRRSDDELLAVYIIQRLAGVSIPAPGVRFPEDGAGRGSMEFSI